MKRAAAKSVARKTPWWPVFFWPLIPGSWPLLFNLLTFHFPGAFAFFKIAICPA